MDNFFDASLHQAENGILLLSLPTALPDAEAAGETVNMILPVLADEFDFEAQPDYADGLVDGGEPSAEWLHGVFCQLLASQLHRLGITAEFADNGESVLAGVNWTVPPQHAFFSPQPHAPVFIISLPVDAGIYETPEQAFVFESGVQAADTKVLAHAYATVTGQEIPSWALDTPGLRI